ncbi:MAG TPA: alpha/beta hydrolase [Stellaceae bacterium]|jgi:pimeloyl-ACP methyl ester carboxylesterase
MTLPETLARHDGHAIAYHRVPGAAPGIVFLAGLRSDMTGTKALYLNQCCRRRGRAYVRFDYFGHGRSSGDFADGTVGRWAEDAIAILDELTHGPQVLVGSSIGGWIMLLAALARPHRIHALVGVAPAPDATEDLLWPRLDMAQRHELLTKGSVTLPSEYDPAGYAYHRSLIEEGRRHLVMRAPIALDCPVRLLHGMCDASVPWSASQRLAERLTSDDVTVTLVKNGDHRLSTAPDLARLAQTLDDLTGVGAQTPAAR